jgi:long-chain acyl-CoA synthetase
MTDRFRWHPEAKLYHGPGRLLDPLPPPGPVLKDSPHGLAQAIGSFAFRVGGLYLPPPAETTVPVFETLTSGSSGQPRRVLRTQASWIKSFAINSGSGIGPGAKVAVLGALVYSLSLYGAIEGLHLGAEVHLLGGPRPDRQNRSLRERQISHLYASPAQLRFLVERRAECPDLRLVMVGGSKLDPNLRAAVQAMAPAAEVKEFYGAAETSFITLADDATPEGSVGRAYPGVEIEVDDGEVWVKSPYLFIGYAGELGSAHWRDGWLSVGEIGRLEDGFLYLQGRAGRMVTVADQNVFPEEIEAILETLPGIRRAAVLPVKDAKRGQVLVALVQGDRDQESRIMARLRAELGPLKAPKALIWLQEWPVLPSGKTDLRALKALVKWPA